MCGSFPFPLLAFSPHALAAFDETAAAVVAARIAAANYLPHSFALLHVATALIHYPITTAVVLHSLPLSFLTAQASEYLGDEGQEGPAAGVC